MVKPRTVLPESPMKILVRGGKLKARKAKQTASKVQAVIEPALPGVLIGESTYPAAIVADTPAATPWDPLTNWGCQRGWSLCSIACKKSKR